MCCAIPEIDDHSCTTYSTTYCQDPSSLGNQNVNITRYSLLYTSNTFLATRKKRTFDAFRECIKLSPQKTQSTEPPCSPPLMNSIYNLDPSRASVKSRIPSLPRTVIIPAPINPLIQSSLSDITKNLVSPAPKLPSPKLSSYSTAHTQVILGRKDTTDDILPSSQFSHPHLFKVTLLQPPPPLHHFMSKSQGYCRVRSNEVKDITRMSTDFLSLQSRHTCSYGLLDSEIEVNVKGRRIVYPVRRSRRIARLLTAS